MIAGLLKVDYATLFREDERRSRRQRWSAVASLLAAAIAVGGAWLAGSVPVDAWARVEVPGEHAGNRLLPARDLAVYRQDPAIRVFRAFGAEYAAQRPDNPVGVSGEAASEAWLAQFRKAALLRLRNAADPANGWQPVARVPFAVTSDLAALGGEAEDSDPEEWGSGQLYLHALLRQPDGDLGFAWSLRYAGRDEDGAAVEIRLPPTAAAHEDPFRLEPWPASEFIRAGALPRWGYLKGDLITAWGSEPQPLVFRLFDAEETFREGNDGMWIESAVVTDGDPGQEVSLGGQGMAIADLEPDAWETIAADSAWAASRAPQVHRISNLDILTDDAGKVTVRDDGRSVELDPVLLQLLQRVLVFEPGVLHPVTRAARRDPGGSVEALSVDTRLFDDITRTEKQGETLYFLRRPGEAWQPLPALSLTPGTVIIDLFPLDAGARALLLLTDVQGFYLTEDGAASWREFNHGEAALLDGERVRAVVAGTPPSIYALVDQGDANRPNPLFRYVRRTWTERLRISVVRLLQPAGQAPR